MAADREICVSPQTSGARSYANLSRARVARAIYRINFVGYAINLMVTNNKQSLTFHQTSTLKFLSQVNCPSCERKRITRLDNLEQHQRSTTRTGRRNDGGNLSGGLGHVSLKILFYFYLNWNGRRGGGDAAPPDPGSAVPEGRGLFTSRRGFHLKIMSWAHAWNK